MKTILTFASAAALAAATLSANAWWAVPYQPCNAPTAEQQKAMTEQQKAFAQKRQQAFEQMMAAQRKMAEQMAAQQAEMVKRAKANGYAPAADSFFAGPWGNDRVGASPWGDDAFNDFGPMGAEPPFANPWAEGPFAGEPKMPQAPTFPDMPAPPAMDVGQPPVPAFVNDHYAAMEAQRAKLIEESKARHDKAMKEMNERREKLLARYTSARPFMMPYGSAAKAPEQQTAAPAPASKSPATATATETN
jgi:hypothetical protein